MENINVNSATKEIIIKCSLEEMVKAFFEEYAIIWHDPNVNNQENQQYITQLKKFCEVFTFTEWEKAKGYIQSTQAVCHVITSGTNGELLVKEIFKSENVSNIYVFCTNKEYHSLWAKDFAKVSCIETNIQNLINNIQQNLLGWYKEASSLKLNLPAFAQVFNDSDKSEMNHLHRYLKVIPKFKNRQQAKEDFVKLSKGIYSDPIIEEFEKGYNEYNKEKTLRWYTRESFLYKVTNNCLRIATSDSILYCRLLLKDIEEAIKDQYQAKSKNFHGLLFRGAYLSDTEWLNLKQNQDKEIEMHGFLSVSKNKKIALNFMENDANKKILITILIPKGPNEEEQGFAEMEEYSQYPMEKEVLFNVRSRFTVLETEDNYEYSAGSSCRHLILLYGAQGFRKFITEQNPAQEVSIPKMKNVSCAHCHVKSEELFFVSISENRSYCKACIDYGVAPFLCHMDKVDNKPYTAKINGCLLRMNSNQEQIPFYGYRCCNCQLKQHKSYFICTDCGGGNEKWCPNCFDSKNLDCLKAKHNIVLETSPFSFWCEKMSVNEFSHLKFQNDSVQIDGDVFQQAEMYFQSHKYERAREYYSLYIQENEGRGKDANLATSYNNIGTVYNNQGEYKKALEYFLKSLDIRKSVYGDNHPLVAASYNNIGLVYQNQREYKKALEYLLKSLPIYKSVYGDNDPEVATFYNNIGSIYKDQGEYKKALEYLLKSLEIRKSVYGGGNHPLVATSYNNIGGVYEYQGEHKKALEHYLKSLGIRKSVYGDNHPEVANLHNNIGKIYYHQGEYKKAFEHYLKSLDIRKSVYGDNHPDVAASYNNIGGAYYNQGEYQRALEYFLKSLDIHKSVSEDNHPEVATSHNNIGTIYYHQGEYKKALEHYLKCLDIRKSVFGENHPEVATLCNNIGSVYDDQGEDRIALEYYLKSLDIRKSVYGDHPEVATSYNNIGNLYINHGEYQKALEYYLKSLDIRKSVYGGDNHPLVAASYTNIGLAYSRQGEYKKALEYHLKSLHIHKCVYGGDNHPEVANSYNDIGTAYCHQGGYKKALEHYLKSLHIRKSVYGGDNHPEVANSYSDVGTVYCHQGGYKKALEHYLKSLGIRKSVYGGDNHPEVANSYNDIGTVYCNQGEYKKALGYLLKSLEIRKFIYGDNHPFTIKLQNVILQIQSTHKKKL